MIRKLFYRLPVPLRYTLRKLWHLPSYLIPRKRYNGIPLPRKGEIFTGGGNFLKNGLIFKQYFIELGGLKPESSFLDIGCGLGRMAIPLTDYLKSPGHYEGFDVVKKGTDWCTDNISSRYPNFRFTYVDLENDLYKNTGSSATNFSFPFGDAVFDLANATSVFTHMLYQEVENYLRETNRVLKPGGKALFTFFILNDESKKCIVEGKSRYSFPHVHGKCFLMDNEVLRANVAFAENELKQLVSSCGFEIEKTLYGAWCGRENPFDFQDILILKKQEQ